ncbi:MAG: HEAT repeat domain-containing protein [Myxococcales bacterium]|nr:HEAT repeat domain-containing protein [Myxococcales bacterium]
MSALLVALLAFDPASALQLLASGQDASALLASVGDLPLADVEAARSAGLPAAIGRLVADPQAPVAWRLLGARALGRLGTDAADGLGPLAAAPVDTPEGAALAREAALALAQLGRADLLGPALASADPEVRRHAAASGADPARLCALLGDPWPLVRVAAARGLGRAPAAAACLARGLEDPDVRVQVAAARAAIEARPPALRAPLRQLAGRGGRAGGGPRRAFAALAALGDLELAERASPPTWPRGHRAPGAGGRPGAGRRRPARRWRAPGGRPRLGRPRRAAGRHRRAGRPA